MDTTPLQVLVVDDEPLARDRLRQLLMDCRDPAARVAAEAASATQAMEWLRRRRFDLVLLDLRMPGADGLALARALRSLPEPPPVVFVTAHPGHALEAFEVDAVDYLTKPVRAQRLQQALRKAGRMAPPVDDGDEDCLVIHDRGVLTRLPLREVLYFKAELKYVTVRTVHRAYILDATLADLQARHGDRFLRIHRNALVARRAIRALQRVDEPSQPGPEPAEEGDTWVVRLAGTDEVLAVSRRQLGAVREAIGRRGRR